MTELVVWKLVAFSQLIIAALMTVLYVFAKLRTEAAERREHAAIDAMRDERHSRQDVERLLVAEGEQNRMLQRWMFGMGTPERRRANINADVVSQLLCGERVLQPREEGEA